MSTKKRPSNLACFAHLKHERYGGDDNDGGCIVVVGVSEPENAAEDLEDVERMQSLHQHQHEYSLLIHQC